MVIMGLGQTANRAPDADACFLAFECRPIPEHLLEVRLRVLYRSSQLLGHLARRGRNRGEKDRISVMNEESDNLTEIV